MGEGSNKAVATTSSKQSRNDEPSAKAEAAEKAVAVILSSYPPDLAKGAKDYAKQLMRHFEGYSLPIIERLADPHHGIVTRCKFPPTIADVVEFVAEFVKSRTFVAERPAHYKLLNDREPEAWAIAALNAVAAIVAGPALTWAQIRFAFHEDEAVLAFLDRLDVPDHRKAVGLTLARKGREAALAVIRAGMAARLVARETTALALGRQPQGRISKPEPDREMCFVPLAPKFDIGDFPDGSAGKGMSSGEWRQWAAREIGKETPSS